MALALFNDVIIRVAVDRKLSVIELVGLTDVATLPAGSLPTGVLRLVEVACHFAGHDLSGLARDPSVVEAVRAVGDELASRDAAAFRVVVEGPVRYLNPIVRDEVYSIAREALRNAFTHACAAHIDTEITFDERAVRLRIRDDGKGIAPDVAGQGRAGHYGLKGMQERARRIGAKLAILSGAGTGAEIDLSVAGSIAYAKPPGRPRFSLLRKLMR